MFHKEWREHFGLSLETVAGRIGDEGIDRSTIQRWESQPWRLDPDKMAALAEALGLEVEDLYNAPAAGRSIAGLTRDASDEMKALAADIVTRLVLKR